MSPSPAIEAQDVYNQVNIIENYDSRGSKRCRFLRALCQAELAGEFEKVATEGAVGFKRAAEQAYRNAGLSKGDGSELDSQTVTHLLESVVELLGNYYREPNQSIDVVISFPDRKTFRPRFERPNPQAGGTGVTQGRAKDTLDVFRKKFHRYHRTRDRDGEFWTHTELEFSQRIEEPFRPSGDRRNPAQSVTWTPPYLRGVAPSLGTSSPTDPGQKAAVENRHMYEFEARLSGSHIVVHLQARGSKGGSDVGLEFFPFVQESSEIYCGAGIIQTYDTTKVAASIVIMSEQPLEGLESLPSGRVPVQLEPTLRRVWVRQSVFARAGDLDQLTVYPRFPHDPILNAIPTCKRLRLSVTWFPHLSAWRGAFERGLRNDAEMIVLLSHPDSAFAKLRGDAALKNPWLAKKEILENRDILRSLQPYGKLSAKRTNWALPISYLEIDGTVYFSGLWFGHSSSEGYWFATPVESEAGKFLVRQFEDLARESPEDDLSSANEGLGDLEFLERITSNSWVGTMTDVYREDGKSPRAPEVVRLEFLGRTGQGGVDGPSVGKLLVALDNGIEITILLQDLCVRGRHVSFNCESRNQPVKRVGVLLLELDEEGRRLRGYYTGWSARTRTHHCGKLELELQNGPRQ